MIIKPLICFVFVSGVVSSPVPNVKKVLYDQRQEGEWNVHASLKNFVLLVIPSQSMVSSAPSLLDFLGKTIPKLAYSKRIQQHLNQVSLSENKNEDDKNVNFIESKTAPYHVDISNSKNDLAKLHPEVVSAEEIVIAQSPSIALVKDEKPHSRIARAFVLTVPPEENYAKKGEAKKKKETSKSVLKLLGAENEQCGPGLSRDAEGVCRTIKN